MELLSIDYYSVDNLIIAMDKSAIIAKLKAHGFVVTETTIPGWYEVENHPAEKILNRTRLLTNNRLYNPEKNIEVHLVQPQFWSAVVMASATQGELNVDDRVQVFCSIYRSLIDLLSKHHK